MKKNIGLFDRIIRILISITFVVLYFTGVINGTWGIILLVLAVVLLITSFTGFCALYTLFGLKTCRNTRNSNT